MRSVTALALASLIGAAGCGARSGLRDVDGARTLDAGLDAFMSDALVGDAFGIDAFTPDAPGHDAPLDAHVVTCLEDRSLCDDHSLCTTDACSPDGTCTHAAITCDDHDPCTANQCDPAVGCTFPPTDCQGCADGARDGFLDLARYPRIAACAGGFAIMGLSRDVSPTCGRGAGDDGPNPSGRGCTATDLCAPGWHVCRSASDVASRSPDGCDGLRDAPPSSFFATRQTGPGCGVCATGTDPTCTNNDCRQGCLQTDMTTNDIFGCGDLGGFPDAVSCGALDRFSNNLCGDLLAPWRCDGDPAGLHESDLVVKPGPEHGGVLCCID